MSIEKRPVYDVDNSAKTYAEYFQSFLRDNFPHDFKYKFEQCRPYLIVSAIMWPSFWLYRGIDWKAQSQNVSLSSYINRTHFQAKGIQMAILALCLLDAYTRNRKNGSS